MIDDIKNNIDIEEEIINEEEEEFEKVKFNPKDIDIAVQPLTLYSLLSRIKTNRVNMNTEFQRRGDLWTPYYQSRLIESILLRLPLPSFYFDASDENNWLVVDGLQRLSTLKNFVIDKTLKLKGLEVLEEYNGKKYDDLPISMLSRIEEFQVTVYLIKPGTPKEVKYDVFNRINTGGLTLKPQEIRHALNQGKAADYLRSFVYEGEDGYEYNMNYNKYINVNDKRMDGRELILRYIAFYRNDWRTYKPTLLNFLNEEMEDLVKLSMEEQKKIQTQLWKVCELLTEIFGRHIFSKSLIDPNSRITLNSSLFEIWTAVLAKQNDQTLTEIKAHKEDVKKDFANLLKDREFNNSISISTASRKNVNYRFSQIEDLVKKFSYVKEYHD